MQPPISANDTILCGDDKQGRLFEHQFIVHSSFSLHFPIENLRRFNGTQIFEKMILQISFVASIVAGSICAYCPLFACAKCFAK